MECSYRRTLPSQNGEIEDTGGKVLADSISEVDIRGSHILAINNDDQRKQLTLVLTTVQGEEVSIIFHAGTMAEPPTVYRQFERLPEGHAARHITWWDEPVPNNILFALESGDVLIIQAKNTEVRL